MIKRIKEWWKKSAVEKFSERYKEEVRRNLIACSNGMRKG